MNKCSLKISILSLILLNGVVSFGMDNPEQDRKNQVQLSKQYILAHCKNKTEEAQKILQDNPSLLLMYTYPALVDTHKGLRDNVLNLVDSAKKYMDRDNFAKLRKYHEAYYNGDCYWSGASLPDLYVSCLSGDSVAIESFLKKERHWSANRPLDLFFIAVNENNKEVCNLIARICNEGLLTFQERIFFYLDALIFLKMSYKKEILQEIVGIIPDAVLVAPIPGFISAQKLPQLFLGTIRRPGSGFDEDDIDFFVASLNKNIPLCIRDTFRIFSVE